MLLMAGALAGCYTVDQTRFSAFVANTIQPGMPMEQVAVRMAAEGFYCDGRVAAPAIVCSRGQRRVFPGSCIERVELGTTGGGKTLARIEIAPIVCPHL